MTDGILLAEIQRDRMLRRYDTLIIDEAHERSLNIDFLLGYLRQLLPRRPDLKLIVTSATIDTAALRATTSTTDRARSSRSTGRTYPGRDALPPARRRADDDGDQVQAVCDAVDELEPRGHRATCWCSCRGEREIHDTADALRRLDLRDTEVLPLYARLSAPSSTASSSRTAARRIVLATNVAETSLTVPGRALRRRHRHGAHLPLQPRGSRCNGCRSSRSRRPRPNQRAGRCGRVAPGICIRLYDEDDFAARPEFTEPEILRTNLAVGHPADDEPRPRRRRRVPVPRAARPPRRSATATCCSRSSARSSRRPSGRHVDG